jgi:hypothetical protein
MTKPKDFAGCSNATVCSSCRLALMSYHSFCLWYWAASILPCGSEIIDDLVSWLVIFPAFIVGCFCCFAAFAILGESNV